MERVKIEFVNNNIHIQAWGKDIAIFDPVSEVFLWSEGMEQEQTRPGLIDYLKSFI